MTNLLDNIENLQKQLKTAQDMECRAWESVEYYKQLAEMAEAICNYTKVFESKDPDVIKLVAAFLAAKKDI